ncbi:MAG: hypothetical protein AAFV53_17135 [Myxococcota bacterium]
MASGAERATRIGALSELRQRNVYEMRVEVHIQLIIQDIDEACFI